MLIFIVSLLLPILRNTAAAVQYSAIKGECQSGDPEIDQGCLHHIRFDRAKEQLQNRPGKHKAEHAKGGTDHSCHQDQLAYALLGILNFSGTQVLTGDHSAAGSQTHKEGQDHRVDHIHQGDTGNSRLTGRRHHHAVCQANKNVEGLLNDQRNDQTEQLPIGKQGVFYLLHENFTFS